MKRVKLTDAQVKVVYKQLLWQLNLRKGFHTSDLRSLKVLKNSGLLTYIKTGKYSYDPNGISVEKLLMTEQGLDLLTSAKESVHIKTKGWKKEGNIHWEFVDFEVGDKVGGSLNSTWIDERDNVQVESIKFTKLGNVIIHLSNGMWFTNGNKRIFKW